MSTHQIPGHLKLERTSLVDAASHHFGLDKAVQS